MSWSSSVRVLGVCSLWFSVLSGCGGNPTALVGNGGKDGGGSGGTAASGNGGTAGSFVIDTGGENNEPGEGGSGNPTNAVCGNKELEPGEFCDDGNTEDDDGCSADCVTPDPDFDCSGVGEPCVKVVICGSGVIEGNEACDDGNTDDGDGCSADCSTVDDGWVCVRPGKPCVSVSVCGNGVRERGEQCDDGEMPPAADDGCDVLCQIEPDYYCPIPGQACVQEVCGDGVRTPNEACDDDDLDDGDGCSSTCTVEAGWHCNASGCKSECGDGMVVGAEECDDGDAIGGDGCSSGCRVEPFYTCNQAEPSVCSPSVSCGNGVLEPIFSGGQIVDHEVCDPPGQNGCLPGCLDFDLETSNPPVCGNNVIEDGEACEPPSDPGCSATCQVENGWTCPPGNPCTRNPFCGDGVVDFAQGEECDDGDMPPAGSDGCSAACKVEATWVCTGLGPSVCVKPVCGNGVLEGSEQCDDHNTINTDGCSSTCTVQTGWACPTVNASCIPRCGDGMKVGAETLAGGCDDGDTMSGDGCNAGCKVEPGFKCPTAGQSCVASVCGDGVVDAGEGCDPNNTGRCFNGNNPGTACNVGSSTCTGAGAVCRPVAGDGCGATCQPEPTVTPGINPTVTVSCGDGLVTGTEECDDGNTKNLDGCDDDCFIEDGWDCDEDLDLPSSLEMRVRYRDFKAGNAKSNDGHTDFQYQHLGHVAGITGLPCTSTNQASCGRLNALGKPPLIIDDQEDTGIMNADTFSLWYTDSTSNTGGGGIKNHLGNNIAIQAPFVSTLTLTQTPAGSETYVYDSNGNNFFPFDSGALNNQGYGEIGDEVNLCNNGNGVTNVTGDPACDGCDGTCRNRNYNFTTELRYFFQYKGGETLSFIGDDDVWVYINGRLAVDMGGLHGEENGQVVLGDDGSGAGGVDSNCSKHSGTGGLPNVATCYTQGERDDNTDSRFQHYDAMGNVITPFVKGGVYEIVLFHAERHTSASNFKLTLQGFLAPRSFCEPVCGDGVVVGDEACDDGMPPSGNSDTIAGRCNTTCTARLYCGDGIKQVGEACDDGTNTDIYTSGVPTSQDCAPGCQTPNYCGDSSVQAGYGEKCDAGNANSANAYSPGCKTGCQLGGYCGDGVKNGPEECDRGAMNGKEYGPGSCTYTCLPGPSCGDGIRNGSEKCDDGVNNGTPTSHCTTECAIKPYCGDGVKGNSPGEQCDWGQFAMDPPEYGGCSTMCMNGPMCGDGMQDPEEECDNGGNNNDSSYDGCNTHCAYGPRCGDGVVQASEGEACDNGFNEDDYDDPKTAAMECGEGCTPPPFCGDGQVQSAYELCDEGPDNSDTAYEGCTSTCEFGPYCGDGDIDGDEVCDDGLDNVSYDPEIGHCSYDCQMAPYCGDGERNGPEQCDLGVAQNTGDYGTCNADCTFAPYCGDGVRQAPEQCDDGGVSQSCSATCKKRVVVQ